MPSRAGAPRRTCEEHCVHLSQCSATHLFILQQQCRVIMSYSFAALRCSVSNAFNMVQYIKLSTGA